MEVSISTVSESSDLSNRFISESSYHLKAFAIHQVFCIKSMYKCLANSVQQPNVPSRSVHLIFTLPLQLQHLTKLINIKNIRLILAQNIVKVLSRLINNLLSHDYLISSTSNRHRSYKVRSMTQGDLILLAGSVVDVQVRQLTLGNSCSCCASCSVISRLQGCSLNRGRRVETRSFCRGQEVL